MNYSNDENNFWRIVWKSVIGHSHKRSGLPNQDAIYYSVSQEENGLPLVIALSDGHGSNKSFRSNIGSDLAVKETVNIILDFFNECLKNDIQNYSLIKNELEERLPKKIVQAWRKRVENHIQNNPFSSEELAKLKNKEGDKVLQIIENNCYIVYGATLLIAAVTKTFIFYMQLGDGDILNVFDNKQTVKVIPRDEKFIANETTSLCSKDSWNEFKIKFQAINSELEIPSLILLSTDGYSNSFRDDENFMKVGNDILEIIRSEGIRSITDNIESWLNASSEKSGDDVTLGMIIRNVAQ